MAGLQVPLTPFSEVEGSEGAVVFRQSGPMDVKTGVVFMFIITEVLAVLVQPFASVTVTV